MTPSNLDAVDGAPSTATDATPEGAATGARSTDADTDTATDATPEGAATDVGGVVEAVRKPRVARRLPKTDSVLEAAVERARQGVLEVAPEAQVGRHVSATIDGERLVTHRFEAFVPGYGGWQWYASVARVARSKDVTVCEVGLLPSEASLLAPEWLPWAERVRPEDSPQEDAAPAAEAAPSDAAGDAAAPEGSGATDAAGTADTGDSAVTADAGATPSADEDEPETSAADRPDAE